MAWDGGCSVDTFAAPCDPTTRAIPVAAAATDVTANRRGVMATIIKRGAGDGNRTHVNSLEGCRTTIVLRPLWCRLVARRGFEPLISGLKGRRPSPLDERAKPSDFAGIHVVGGEGFEPPTSSMSSWRSPS